MGLCNSNCYTCCGDQAEIMNDAEILQKYASMRKEELKEVFEEDYKD